MRTSSLPLKKDAAVHVLSLCQTVADSPWRPARHIVVPLAAYCWMNRQNTATAAINKWSERMFFLWAKWPCEPCRRQSRLLPAFLICRALQEEKLLFLIAFEQYFRVYRRSRLRQKRVFSVPCSTRTEPVCFVQIEFESPMFYQGTHIRTVRMCFLYIENPTLGVGFRRA